MNRDELKALVEFVASDFPLIFDNAPPGITEIYQNHLVDALLPCLLGEQGSKQQNHTKSLLEPSSLVDLADSAGMRPGLSEFLRRQS